eukprot:UN25364
MESNRKAVIKFYLDAARSNEKCITEHHDEQGRDCLMLAVIWGHKDLVDEFKRFNNFLNRQDDQKNTAFMYAVLQENEDLIESLRETKKIDESAKNSAGFSAGMIAQGPTGSNKVKDLFDPNIHWPKTIKKRCIPVHFLNGSSSYVRILNKKENFSLGNK